MRIRAAGVEDVPAVVALEEQLFGPDAWSSAVATEEVTLADRRAVVACMEDGMEESSVVGYAVGRLAGDVADLHRIAVVAAHRRSGVARSLLGQVLQEAKDGGATRLLLEVSAENHAALAFYAAEGFTEIDRRPRYYRDGSDALVLRCALGAPSCGGGTR